MATTRREQSKAAFQTNLQMASTIKGVLGGMSDKQLADVLAAYVQLMRPTEQTEMVVATDILAQMALLAAKTVTQEMVFRKRS